MVHQAANPSSTCHKPSSFTHRAHRQLSTWNMRLSTPPSLPCSDLHAPWKHVRCVRRSARVSCAARGSDALITLPPWSDEPSQVWWWCAGRTVQGWPPCKIKGPFVLPFWTLRRNSGGCRTGSAASSRPVLWFGRGALWKLWWPVLFPCGVGRTCLILSYSLRCKL